MKKKKIKWNTEMKWLIALIVYMPFHYYICECLISFTSVDNLIRDFIIIGLSLYELKKHNFKIQKKDRDIIINISVLIAFAVVSYIAFSFPETFNILRTYMIPMLIYFVSVNVNLNKEQLDYIHKLILIEFTIISVWGLFQAFVLGDDFLIRLGYPSIANGTYLAGNSYYIGGFYGRQRSVGTFVSPNVAGCLFAMIAAIPIAYIFNKRKVSIVWLVLLLIGLVGTISRSSMFALLGSFIFYKCFLNIKSKLSRNAFLRFFILIIVAVLGFYLADKYLSNGLLSTMLTSSFRGMNQRTDLSTQKHIEDLTEPLKVVVKYPFGRGFGSNGPMASGTTTHYLNVESSIYLMMYELGPVFGILFYEPLFSTIWRTVKNKSSYSYFVPCLMSITAFVTFILLPNVQTYEILFYLYLFIGFYRNRSIRELYNHS